MPQREHEVKVNGHLDPCLPYCIHIHRMKTHSCLQAKCQDATLPPPWQATLILTISSNLLHLGALNVFHVGLYHLQKEEQTQILVGLSELTLHNFVQRRLPGHMSGMITQ